MYSKVLSCAKQMFDYDWLKVLLLLLTMDKAIMIFFLCFGFKTLNTNMKANFLTKSLANISDFAVIFRLM